MTVKELREQLAKYPEDMEVKISTYVSNESYDDHGWSEELDVTDKGIQIESKNNKEYLLLNWEF